MSDAIDRDEAIGTVEDVIGFGVDDEKGTDDRRRIVAALRALPADPRAAAAEELAAASQAYRHHRKGLTGKSCPLVPCHYAEALDRALAAWRSLAKPEPAPERCGGVNCANPRCHYMVSCTQGLCDKCGTRVQPCPRCARGGSHD
jgi:hypothetical protein